MTTMCWILHTVLARPNRVLCIVACKKELYFCMSPCTLIIKNSVKVIVFRAKRTKILIKINKAFPKTIWNLEGHSYLAL